MQADKNKGTIYSPMEKLQIFLSQQRKMYLEALHMLTSIHVLPLICEAHKVPVFFPAEINVLVLFSQMRTPDFRIPCELQNNHRHSYGGWLEPRSGSYSTLV